MKLSLILYACVMVIIVAAAAFVLWRRRPRKLNKEQFQAKWRELQKMCADRKLWKNALIDADDLLDEALRKRHIRGKNMGERLVRAQREFTNNDGVWFGHKLCNKIEDNPKLRLKETEVKDALIGLRQGLKDLGALQ